MKKFQSTLLSFVFITSVCFLTIPGSDPVVAAGSFSGFKPVRILDTRDGVSRVGNVSGSGTPYRLKVAGLNGVPEGVSAVALNVTATETTAAAWGGFVTVYPCSAEIPKKTSNVNFLTGQTVANSVIAPVSSDGEVCFFVWGQAHLLADISGYFSADGSGGTTDGSGGTTGLNELRFDLKGAVGVALTDEVDTRVRFAQNRAGKLMATEVGSNVLAVDSNGETRRATLSGVANIGRLLAAPNDKLYVLFNERIQLEDTSLQCEYFGGYEDAYLPSWWEYSWTWSDWGWEQSSTEYKVTEGWWSQEEYEVSDPNSNEGYSWTSTRYRPCNEPPCLLGAIDIETGLVECIDNNLDSIWWNDWESTANPAIQFDDAGNVYYHGSGSDEDGYWSGILRMYRQSDGKLIDLVNENMDIENFLVDGDGNVYISGRTGTTNTQWFRVLTPKAGDVRPSMTQIAGSRNEWMYEFPDGNVYFAEEYGNNGIKKYLLGQGTEPYLWADEITYPPSEWDYRSDYLTDADDDLWNYVPEEYVSYEDCQFSPAGSENVYLDEDGDGKCGGWKQSEGYVSFDPSEAQDDRQYKLLTEGCYEESESEASVYGEWYDVVTGEWQSTVEEITYTTRSENYDSWSGMCGSPGNIRQRLHTTAEGEVFGVFGYQWGSSEPTDIGRIYPTSKRYTSVVENAYTVIPVLSTMFLTGLDEDEQYTTTQLNLSTGVETVLIAPEDGLEVYRMNFLATNNRLMFDGLRFSDTSYVIGYVDLSSRKVVASATGKQRLIDFQLFS